MSRPDYQNRTLAEIVTENIRTAELFRAAGIDFCCGGKKTLKQACLENDIDIDSFSEKLIAVSSQPVDPAQDYQFWAPDFLADYIVNVHHRFVKNKLSPILEYTRKIAEVHGGRHPELPEVAKIFNELEAELIPHLRQEEEVLFPAVKAMLKSPSRPRKTILRQEIQRLTKQHETAGESMDKIRVLTRGYEVPGDACPTYEISLRLLKEFEDDLHIHVHLENNILFPAALSLL